MRNGKSVKNGSNGGSMSGIIGGVVSATCKGFGNGAEGGSVELMTTGVGAFPGPIPGARGNAPLHGAEPSGIETPNPEVKVRRRRLTREYKVGVLKALDKVKGKPGAVGEFLRKEGLYSATVTYWRKQRTEGSLGTIRGRKPTDPLVIENGVLEKRIRNLEAKNKQFLLVIEAQKKISEILGILQENVPTFDEIE